MQPFYNAAACMSHAHTSLDAPVYVTEGHLALGTLGAGLGHNLGGLSSTLGLG